MRFIVTPRAKDGRGRSRSAFASFALVLLMLSVAATSAAGHGAVHADDFAQGTEVAAPSGVQAEAPPISGRALSTGPRKVAVLLVNFPDLVSEPWTPDTIRSVIFTGGASVNAFMQEQSFGALSLTGKLAADGDVFGWYQLGVSSSTCVPDAWMSDANAKAAAAGVDLSGYQHYVYMFPKVTACGWAGAADMPGNTNFINGTTSVRVIAHELGHNLGAHHASTVNCTLDGVRVPYSTSCTQSEYGDPFDVMGSTDRHVAAYRKVGYGFFPSTATATATVTGTYQVNASSLGGPGVRSLRIPRAPGRYWYLEVRSPVGQYDDFGAADPAVTGVSIRESGDYGVGIRTLLVDTTPGTATYSDAPLQPGQVFTDPLSGIGVAVQSVALGIATIAVTIPGTTPVPPPAPPPATPPPPPASGVTPPAPRTATISVRRTARSRMSVRVATDVGATARTCAMRAGILRWRSCTITAGKVTVTRAVRVTRSTVLVLLQIDGKLVVVKRVRVPKVGAVRRVTVALLP